MAELLAGLVGLLVGSAALAFAHWWHSPAWRQRVLINFRDLKAPSIEGVIWRRYGRWIVVRDAMLIQGPGLPQPIDGEVVLDGSALLFIQIIDARRPAASPRKDPLRAA